MDKNNEGIISGFGRIRNGFVLFNFNGMPLIGTKIKVEYGNGTQEYKTWNGVPFFDENGTTAILYRICDKDPEMEKHMDIYYVVQSYVLHDRFSDIATLIKTHIKYNENVGTIKTLLIATKKLKNHTAISELRDKLLQKFEKLTGKKAV